MSHSLGLMNSAGSISTELMFSSLPFWTNDYETACIAAHQIYLSGRSIFHHQPISRGLLQLEHVDRNDSLNCRSVYPKRVSHTLSSSSRFVLTQCSMPRPFAVELCVYSLSRSHRITAKTAAWVEAMGGHEIYRRRWSSRASPLGNTPLYHLLSRACIGITFCSLRG